MIPKFHLKFTKCKACEEATGKLCKPCEQNQRVIKFLIDQCERLEREKFETIDATNFTPFLRHVQEAQSEIGRYYHFGSKLWRAICKQIDDEYGFPLIVLPVDHVIPCHRGTGPSIQFRQAWLYAENYDDPKKPKEADVFCLEFEVGVEPNDAQSEFHDHERQIKFSIQVPRRLEEKFSESAFKAWIADKAKEHRIKKSANVAIKQIEEWRRNPVLWEEVKKHLKSVG